MLAQLTRSGDFCSADSRVPQGFAPRQAERGIGGAGAALVAVARCKPFNLAGASRGRCTGRRGLGGNGAPVWRPNRFRPTRFFLYKSKICRFLWVTLWGCTKSSLPEVRNYI